MKCRQNTSSLDILAIKVALHAKKAKQYRHPQDGADNGKHLRKIYDDGTGNHNLNQPQHCSEQQMSARKKQAGGDALNSRRRRWDAETAMASRL